MSNELTALPGPEGTPAPAHSKRGASSMYRWGNCPGSPRLSDGIENVSSPYAVEGTLAHELAAKFLTPGEGDFEASTEMLSNVMTYVDYVNVRTWPSSKRWIEHKFDLSSIYPGCFGTADAVIYNHFSGHLIVIDLKYGLGIPVEIENNEQLKYYALGAAVDLQLPCKTVEMVIAQPRCPHPDGPIRSTTIDGVELIDFAATLVEKAKATEDPNAPLVPGGWCRFCPAAGFCPALHATAIKAEQEEFRTDLSYDPKKLAEVLELVPTIKDWCNSVTEFAYNEANAGRVPPGYKLVEKRATRKWLSEDAASEFLISHGVSKDALYEMSFTSPAQAEKLLDSKKRKALGEFIVSLSTGTTLVHDSDKRQAAKSSAELDFQPVVKATE